MSSRQPANLDAVLKTVTKGGQVNALDDPGEYVSRSAAQGIFPTIYVSTVPAELIMTRGAPSYEPIAATPLLEVANTDDNVIVDPATSLQYVLISGRWFATNSIETGPWTYVPNDKLPADFAKIPVTHPRGVVLPSVAGTPQAQEAVIDNSIPQTANVTRATTTLTTNYGGSPQLQNIDGTPLQYVTSSPNPVIRVDASTWYALKDGVWFEGTSVNGPWAVADSVPDVIYTIPPSSPLHYVTYVYVYEATPQIVTVGYTPGYYGTVLAPTGVVVYGTGYVYPPVYVGNFWYPPPVTYGGFGAGFFWGSVTGFAFGAAAGALWGGAWGHWGGYGSYNNVTINNYNSYNHWTSNQVRTNVTHNYNRLTPQQRQQAQRDYNRRTGQLTPQQRNNSAEPRLDATQRHLRRPGRPDLSARLRRWVAATRQRRVEQGRLQRWGRIGGQPRPPAAGPELRQLGGQRAQFMGRVRRRRLPSRGLGRVARRFRQFPRRLRWRWLRRRSVRWRRSFRRRWRVSRRGPAVVTMAN